MKIEMSPGPPEAQFLLFCKLNLRRHRFFLHAARKGQENEGEDEERLSQCWVCLTDDYFLAGALAFGALAA